MMTQSTLLFPNSDKKCPRLKHGHRRRNLPRSAEYYTWAAMISRCLNKNNHKYSEYGGRGILITPRWLGENGFTNFLDDMGKRPAGRTLDRIDNEKGYSKENCRWATPKEQAANRRKRRPKTKKTFDEALEVWRQVIANNEREHSEDLNTWFDVLEQDGREMFSIPKTLKAERDQQGEDQKFFEEAMREEADSEDAFRAEMYRILDSEIKCRKAI